MQITGTAWSEAGFPAGTAAGIGQIPAAGWPGQDRGYRGSQCQPPGKDCQLSPAHAGAVAIAICAFACLGGFLLVNTLYLQDVRGFSPLLAGVYTLPMAAMTAIFSPLSGRLVGSRGARPSLLVAGVGITAAGLILVHVTAGTATIVLLAAYLLFGLGFGMVNAPITNSTVSGMPRSQAGVAAGVASTSRQVGSSLGVAVIGSATISALHGPFRLDFATASHAGWWIVVGCGVAIFGLGLLVSGSWAHETARRTASKLMPASADQAGAGQQDAGQVSSAAPL